MTLLEYGNDPIIELMKTRILWLLMKISCFIQNYPHVQYTKRTDYKICINISKALNDN